LTAETEIATAFLHCIALAPEYRAKHELELLQHRPAAHLLQVLRLDVLVLDYKQTTSEVTCLF